MSEFIELTSGTREGKTFFVRHSAIVLVSMDCDRNGNNEITVIESSAGIELECKESPAEVIEKINAAKGKQ